MSPTLRISLVLFVSACAACAASATSSGATAGPEPTSEAAPATPSGAVFGHCTFSSARSAEPSCREYVGSAWTASDAQGDCAAAKGTLSVGAGCGFTSILGTCDEDGAEEHTSRVVIPGANAASCAPAKRECVVYAGGTFSPVETTCGSVFPSDGARSGLPVFQQPTRDCVPPKAGQPAGHGPGGKVCTWSAIAGATEEGRKFADYGSCENVFTQRPYHPSPGRKAPAADDPRLADPKYAAELAWVKAQIEATACVCCHSAAAPRGASNWRIDAPGNFMDSFFDSGLALGAGFIESKALGAFAAVDSNGFVRDQGIPSTDPKRMMAFFAAELAHRGKGKADFADAPPFGGPLVDQLAYEPEACGPGQGLGADGKLTWTGGPARYVHVLAAGAPNPTVPPNFDLPPETLWRIDVPYTGSPVRSGISYGVSPTGATQRVPATGSAPELVSGRKYYLYVVADVGAPITRCVFSR